MRGAPMKTILQLFLRVCYPVFMYAIVLAAAAEIAAHAGGILEKNAGLISIGAAAASALGLFYPIYLKERGQVTAAGSGIKVPESLPLLGVGAGFCLVFNPLISWSGLSSEAYAQAEAVLFTADLRLQILLIGFLIPAAEELVFRGLCFSRLRQTAGFPAAAVLSALLFGLFHGNIVQGVYAFWGGLLMAWGYEQCRCLKAPWLIHVSSNLLSLAISSEQVTEYLGGNPFFSLNGSKGGLALGQALAFLLGILLMATGVINIKGKKEV